MWIKDVCYIKDEVVYTLVGAALIYVFKDEIKAVINKVINPQPPVSAITYHSLGSETRQGNTVVRVIGATPTTT